MKPERTFPTRGVLRRPPIRPVDLLVGAGILALIFGAIRLGRSSNVAFLPAHAFGSISTKLGNLPYYAARSLFRMFIALFISVVFTFVYATAAARLRRAEKVLIPMLDILQSVPVLGFLTVTVTAFIALFRGSSLGLEAAAIFAIFTSQAWNMTFSFYHSLITQPRDLDEASRMMRLTKWQRFWKMDVPGSMIGLVWNGMMSFGGGWFFLAASESISFQHHRYVLPGIGSYVAASTSEGSLGKVGVAILVMILMVVGVNVFFWRPLVAWAERFRVEDAEAAERPRSMLLDLMRHSQIPSVVVRPMRSVGRALDRVTRPFGLAEYRLQVDPVRQRVGDFGFWILISAVVAFGAWQGFSFLQRTIGFSEIPHVFFLGAVTFLRVIILVVFATLVWVPVGVWIGMNPRVARFAQPVVQVLASFPANFLFPLAAFAFLRFHISLNIGGIALMALGSQWYILFNAIAGAISIPSDLREAMTSFGVSRWLRWRTFIIPAIFPAYVTGGVTAAGGAWNASIVSEVLDYKNHHLVATGLGAYIAEASSRGDFPRIFAGIAVMSFFVVALNRIVWRRLYRLAEERYSL